MCSTKLNRYQCQSGDQVQACSSPLTKIKRRKKNRSGCVRLMGCFGQQILNNDAMVLAHPAAQKLVDACIDRLGKHYGYGGIDNE